MLTGDERKRYARHLSLAEVGDEGQLRLKRSHVVIVGLGGLGSPASMYLAAAGVGRITLVDGDIVDASNLQRQLAHGTSTLGAPKVESARGRLRDINPHVDIVSVPEHMSSRNALQIVGDCDVVVDASDNFATRYLVNDACLLSAKPYVHASILRFEGQLTTFDAQRGPCYRCLFPSPPTPGLVPSCAEDGVLGVLPGMLGTMQANEALKLMLAIGEPLIGRLVILDALSMRTTELQLKKRPNCAACGTTPTIHSLADAPACPIPTDMVDDYRNAVLVDVREAHEYAIEHIDGALHVPLASLDDHVDELRDRDVVLYCKSGARARRAWELLRAHGLTRVRMLRGGVDDYVHG